MNKVSAYFRKLGIKRIAASLFGILFVGLGIAIFKLASLGNDPYTGMNMALSDFFNIPFPTLQLGVNLALFLLQFVFAKDLIGLGTLVNALFMGSIIDVFVRLLFTWPGTPASFAGKVAVMLVGMVVCSFGISLYQCSDLGVSPYDAASLILDRKLAKIPYFWCRIFTDGFCAVVCYLFGGIVGLGTLVTAFGFGPVISLFNKLLKPLI